ncbi:MAG: flagellar basal body P-ring protein FlgI [Myxococcales bacterium]|nr:flagellar basal body P-ring protein FlgI [Myxococcales bacterium]
MALLVMLSGYLGPWAGRARATRIQELCDVRGVRRNQLIGYGLVVGLAGTGDSGQARFTVQSTAAMLRRLGATIDPRSIQTKNAAAVMVTASIPAFANPGTRIDVVVSSLGNAKSIEGGTLLQTPLYGADRKVYAVAQGPLLIGGFSAAAGGNSVRENHTTVGRIPEGAIVERRAPTPKLSKRGMVLQLRRPSFVTASRIVDAINRALGSGVARAQDGATVMLKVPDGLSGDPVGLLARVQLLEVQADAPVRVVIDERTGTVVVGAGVRIAEVAVAQGGLTVEVVRRPQVSQPGPFSPGGQTRVVKPTEVKAQIRDGAMYHLRETASLSDVVDALNALGARPRNLISIFQALRAAGALQAEFEVQ